MLPRAERFFRSASILLSEIHVNDEAFEDSIDAVFIQVGNDLPMIRISSILASFILIGTLSIAALLVHADYTQAQEASTARFIPLGDLDGGDFYSRPLGISADGSVVVGSSYSARDEEAFRWTEAEGMVPLGDLAGGSFESLARSVSADGVSTNLKIQSQQWQSHG